MEAYTEMKMTSIKMKKLLEDKLKNDSYRISYNRDKDTMRIEWKETKQGITISLPQVVGKFEEKGDEAVQDLVAHVTEALSIMNQDYTLNQMEKHIYPVIRSTSFPTETKEGKSLITKEHTAETRIFYAIDLGKSYRLIEEALLNEEGWSEERLHEHALFNLRALSCDYKKDQVQDNDFYFLATQDGYDASRILNDQFLSEMEAKCEGEMAIAVPHQDVLIIADIKNNTGYDVLAQIAMKFFAEGRIPITSLALMYEDKKLEPIFILAKNKPTKRPE